MTDMKVIGAGRLRTSKRSALLLSLSVITVCALIIAGTLALGGRSLRLASAASSTSVSAERVVIAVEGMHCDGCASGIKAILKRTPGVISADVSYERKEAAVEYDPEKITPEKIVEAITNLGYKASVKG